MILIDLDASYDTLFAVGKSGLQQLLESGATDRSVAKDLLTVDALVTRAFEVADENLEQKARDAMHSLAELSRGDQ